MVNLEKSGETLITEISPNDEMYAGNTAHYFSVGQSALDCIKSALLVSGNEPEKIKSILDLPCGHGRVLRALKASFPNARLTACDLNRDGVSFCERVFGATPVYSRPKVKDIPISDTFDLIWCGSLLTHLDATYWKDFLNLFNAVLSFGGILVFTTHGRKVIEKIASGEFTYGLDKGELSCLLDEYGRKGFGYVDYKKSNNYGISVSSPSFVLSMIEKMSDVRILSFIEKGWDDHQDVVCCSKDPYISISSEKKVGMKQLRLNKEKQYCAKSHKFQVKPNQKYLASTKVVCKQGAPHSAYFAVMMLDSNDKEVARYIRWFRKFSGETQEYSIVCVAPDDSATAILGYRINIETPSQGDFAVELSAFSAATFRPCENMGVQFDRANDNTGM